MIAFDLVKAIIVRLALLLHVTITVWRVTVNLDNVQYWYLGLALIPFVIEAGYTLIKRHGEDFLMFTPCFFFYLIAVIPCVWLLELDKTDSYIEGTEDVLFNATESGPISIGLNPNTWTILIEELLLYLLIVSRWLLPRGKISREQLSELLFAFIGMASDIMEMFSLFGESQVRNNKTLAYCVLSVWSVSVTQFCMTVTVTHQPKKAKNIKVIDDNSSKHHQNKSIRNECVAIFVSMIMQDIPFITLRLYTIITYNLVTYSLVFFTAKNALVIALLLYKIAVLLQKRFCPEPEKKSDESMEVMPGDETGKQNGLRTLEDVKLITDDTPPSKSARKRRAAGSETPTEKSGVEMVEGEGGKQKITQQKGTGKKKYSKKSTKEANLTPASKKPPKQIERRISNAQNQNRAYADKRVGPVVVPNNQTRQVPNQNARAATVTGPGKITPTGSGSTQKKPIESKPNQNPMTIEAEKSHSFASTPPVKEKPSPTLNSSNNNNNDKRAASEKIIQEPPTNTAADFKSPENDGKAPDSPPKMQEQSEHSATVSESGVSVETSDKSSENLLGPYSASEGYDSPRSDTASPISSEENRNYSPPPKEEYPADAPPLVFVGSMPKAQVPKYGEPDFKPFVSFVDVKK